MPQRDNVPATSSPQRLAPGTDVGGYIIECKLGEGGMSVVYGAVQPRIAKRVAIKVLSRTFDDPAAVDRFEQEARLVNSIRHQNIVDVFQFGELPDGRSFFVMEWLEGETVGARLKRGPLQVRETIDIVEAVCDALEAAHEQGVVHRDLKADNVFLTATRKGRAVKLLDFGLAKLAHTDGPTSIHNTGIGILVGTPSYMSPEQARAKDVDGRTDVYSLGCLAYQMLTGSLPFRADNPLDLLNLHLEAPVPAAAKVVDVPRALSDVIRQMMAKAPEQRPTIGQIRDVLHRVRKDTSTRSTGRRNVLRIVLGACLLASVVMIAVTVVALVNSDTSAPKPREAPTGSAGGALAGVAIDAGTASPPPTCSDPEPGEIVLEPELSRRPPVIRIPPSTGRPLTPGRPDAAANTGSGSGSGSASGSAASGSDSSGSNPSNENRLFLGALILTIDVASEISIDGTVRATNSLGGRFELKPGKHSLRITAPRRQTVEREVEIQPAATTTMSISAGVAPAQGPPPTVDAGTAEAPKPDDPR